MSMTAAQLRSIRDLHAKGTRPSVIAHNFNVHVNTIRDIVRSPSNVTRTLADLTPADRRNIYREYLSGRPVIDLAANYEVRLSVIYNIIIRERSSKLSAIPADIGQEIEATPGKKAWQEIEAAFAANGYGPYRLTVTLPPPYAYRVTPCPLGPNHPMIEARAEHVSLAGAIEQAQYRAGSWGFPRTLPRFTLLVEVLRHA